MKKLNITFLILGVIFLGYLIWRIGPGQLWVEIVALGWGVIPIILSEGLANLAHTLGWRYCFGSGHPPVPLPRLFRIAMAGFAINYLTPSASVGGEASKIALLANGRPPTETVSSILLDKLTTAIAHLLLVMVGAALLLWLGSLPTHWWIALMAVTVPVAGGLAMFLWLQRHGKLGGFFRWLADRRFGGDPVRKFALRVSAVDEALREFYCERPGCFAQSVGWHLVGHSVAFVHVWIFLGLIGASAPLVAVLVAGFLSLWCDLLTFAIPLNLGALEGSRILALNAVGGQASVGLAFGVAIRIAQLSWACFGLGNYFLLALRRPTLQPMASGANAPTNATRGSSAGYVLPGRTGT